MIKNNWTSLSEGTVDLLKFGHENASEIEKEIKEGVDLESFNIASFKVEQKIIDITSSNSLNIGGFVNGNSNIKKLQIRYLASLFSNKFKTIVDPKGNIIRKRYGYGYGFTLDVSDIDTKININFGVLAASAALDLSKIEYHVNVFGVQDNKLAKYLPDDNRTFDSDTFAQLQRFITKAKAELKTLNTGKLYPIEVLNSTTSKLEDDDVESIYYGVLRVKDGLSLEDAILEARKLEYRKINENVVQFIYTYFELNNAYTKPNSDQKQNARRWISGSYNKSDKSAIGEDSWVDIDPATDNGNYVALTNYPKIDEYKPHPPPENWATEPKVLKEDFSEVSLNFSSSLKIASTIDASGKFNTVTLNRSIASYSDVSDNGFEGSKVIETRYGIGIRLKLKISNIAIGTEVNFSSIGAVSELGHANVEYEISGIGISDPDFLKELPGPINISQNSMNDINKAFNKLKDKISEMDVSKLNPQPYRIRVNEPEKIDPTLKAQATVFSIGKVANRTKLADAINEGTELGINKEHIISTYKTKFEISNINQRIGASDKNEAREWLVMKYND